MVGLWPGRAGIAQNRVVDWREHFLARLALLDAF